MDVYTFGDDRAWIIDFVNKNNNPKEIRIARRVPKRESFYRRRHRYQSVHPSEVNRFIFYFIVYCF